MGRLAAAGVDAELVLVGDGPLRRPIERLIADRHLKDRIRLTGWLDEAGVRHEMLNSRALVLPSFAEGLPAVIMESLALHRPVITTHIAGIPELVQPGINGWLIPAGSVQSLTEAMHEALSAPPDLLERMGQAGAMWVTKLHDRTVEVGKLADLIAGHVVPRGIASLSFEGSTDSNVTNHQGA